jgi:hypothetical protein
MAGQQPAKIANQTSSQVKGVPGELEQYLKLASPTLGNYIPSA